MPTYNSYQEVAKALYNPMGNQREQLLYPFVIVGNNSMATVCQCKLVRVAVQRFDNQDDGFPEDVPSAFDRAVNWATANKNDPKYKIVGLLGLDI